MPVEDWRFASRYDILVRAPALRREQSCPAIGEYPSYTLPDSTGRAVAAVPARLTEAEEKRKEKE